MAPGTCREQFSIPQATPAYEEIVRQLPSEFVGPASSEPPLSSLSAALHMIRHSIVYKALRGLIAEFTFSYSPL